MMDTAREVINSEDGWSGLWRGMKASLVLVVNPAITYGAYQRLRDVLYPGKTSLRPFEAFSKLITITAERSTTNAANQSWVRFPNRLQR